MKEKGFPEIGKRLLSIRGELDQRAFSQRVNVSQQAISNYERGNLPASWAFLRYMLEDFNVNLNWLISGQGQRDYRVGTPFAALTDNRPPAWPRSFLSQVALEDADRLELLVGVYLLYLSTEPTDAKARLMGDLQAITEAARLELEESSVSSEDKAVRVAVYDALARDDRRAVVSSLIRAGEQLERVEKKRVMAGARKLYLAALGLARFQGWPEEELEAARRVGRSYRKEGRWAEAERFFRLAISTFEGKESDGTVLPSDGHPESSASPALSRARVFLGYGYVAKNRGDLPAARERYMTALNWALKSQDPGLRAEVYLDLACLSYREKDLQKALDFVASGRAFAEEAGNRPLQRQFRLTEALVLSERGEAETAETILRVIRAQAREEEDTAILSLASVNLVDVLVGRGEYEAAQDLLNSSAPDVEAHGDPRARALRKLLQAKLAAAKGEEGAARAWLSECVRYASEHGLSAEFEARTAAVLGGVGAAQPSAVSKAG